MAVLDEHYLLRTEYAAVLAGSRYLRAEVHYLAGNLDSDDRGSE